jgi:glycosyltransferase involved in cell wall biosynthesis
MRYAWDWTHRYFDENNLKGFKAKIARKLIHKVRLWDKISADRPDVYLANSIHTQKRIQKYYRLESTVVYPPVDVDRFQISETNGDFYLIVSTLAPFKRIDIAVEAFNMSGKKLVIIGDGADKARLERMAKKNIEFRGFQTDAEVADAMGQCRALVFPGEEDFGITPVEAMACGKPVIAYGKGGLLETVVDGETGVFFQKPNPESLIEAVGRFEGMNFQPAIIAERAKMFDKNGFRDAVKSAVVNY